MDNVDPESGQYVFTVLLPARLIPKGSIVTKRSGSVEYKLESSIRVYSKPDLEFKEQRIESDGVCFLLGEHGSINAISDHTVLSWQVLEGDLLDFLVDRDYTNKEAGSQ